MKRAPKLDSGISRVYLAHFRRLFRRVNGAVDCAAAAEDLTQESFLRWFTRLRDLEDRGEQHLGLLYRIGHALSIDFVRRRETERRILDGWIPAQVAPDTESIVVALDQARHADRAMKALPPRTRAAFQMRREDQLAFKDIAAALGVSTPRAHQLAAEALAKVAASMAENDADQEKPD
ncbi:MAG: RNA polymerase sigma factor [Pseudomonadota bacterium]